MLVRHRIFLRGGRREEEKTDRIPRRASRQRRIRIDVDIEVIGGAVAAALAGVDRRDRLSLAVILGVAGGAGIDDLDGDGGAGWGADGGEVADVGDGEAGWGLALVGDGVGA